LHDELGNERHIAECPPRVGVEDLVIVPMVVIALAISKLLKAVFSILIYVLDYAFPILLQLIRIPLLAGRLLGDGIELFLEGVVRCLPMSRAKREAWRARVRQQWIWFRRNISYQAFEHALHHAYLFLFIFLIGSGPYPPEGPGAGPVGVSVSSCLLALLV